MSSKTLNNSGYNKQFINIKSPVTSPRADAMSTKSKGTGHSRVLTNNIRGRPVDKITAEQMKPENEPFQSIYRQEFSNKGKGHLYKSQELPKTKNTDDIHIVNLPNGKHVEPQQENSQHKEATNEEKSIIDPQMYKSEFYTIDGQPIPLPDQKSFGARSFSQIPYLKPEEAKYYEDMRNLVYKLKYRGPRGSVYQKDFVPQPLDDQGPVWKNDFYSTVHNTKNVDYGTTSRADFKNWKMGPVKRETMNWKPASTGIPFGGRSNYRAEFVDWGCNIVALDKPKQPLTTIPELPLLGKTTYRDNFSKPVGGQKAELVQMELFGKKSPLNSAIPFMGESMSMSTYKPFKVTGVQEIAKPKEKYEPTLSHKGLFSSTYRSDFMKHSESADPKKFMIPKFSFL